MLSVSQMCDSSPDPLMRLGLVEPAKNTLLIACCFTAYQAVRRELATPSFDSTNQSLDTQASLCARLSFARVLYSEAGKLGLAVRKFQPSVADPLQYVSSANIQPG